MSGQLVGDVLAAADRLRERGLTERGFYALIAIADRASTNDRTASVRWDHVRAGLYGASKRTAQRAVDDLIEFGAIRVIKVGFKNEHASRAPIYEILPLVDDDTWLSSSVTEDRDSRVSRSSRVDDDKSASGSRQIESGSRHLGVLLDVSFDGSFDGGRARECEPLDAEPDPEPPPFCPEHPSGTRKSCPPCGDHRRAHDAWQTRQHDRDRAEGQTRRYAIAACPDCDEFGQVDLGEAVAHCRHPKLSRTTNAEQTVRKEQAT